MLTTRADSCPARLTCSLPRLLVAAVRPASSQRWVDRMRYRASDAPYGLSAAHHEIVNGRRVCASGRGSDMLNWPVGTVGSRFHVKHDCAAVSVRAPSPDVLAPVFAQ